METKESGSPQTKCFPKSGDATQGRQAPGSAISWRLGQEMKAGRRRLRALAAAESSACCEGEPRSQPTGKAPLSSLLLPSCRQR